MEELPMFLRPQEEQDYHKVAEIVSVYVKHEGYPDRGLYIPALGPMGRFIPFIEEYGIKADAGVSRCICEGCMELPEDERGVATFWILLRGEVTQQPPPFTRRPTARELGLLEGRGDGGEGMP